MSADAHAIMAVLELLRRVFPPPPLDKVTTLTYDELKQKYRWVNFWLGILALVLVPAICCGLFFAAGLLADLYYSTKGGVRFLFRPSWIELGVYLAILGFPLSLPLIWLGARGLLGARYLEFLAFTGVRSRWHGEKVAWVIFLVYFVPTAPFIVLRFDHYTAFRDDAMAVSPYWTLGVEQTSAYSDIRAIYSVARARLKKDEIIASPHHAIVFEDGTIWTSRDQLASLAGGGEAEWIQMVSTKSGRTVQNVDLDEDIPKGGLEQ